MESANFYANKNGKAPKLSTPEIIFKNDGTQTVQHQMVNFESRNVGSITVDQNTIYASDLAFVELETDDETLGFKIPNGVYQTVVTIADVSEEQDGSHKRTAYISLIRNNNIPMKVKPAQSLDENESDTTEDSFWYFPVDAGTGCFYTLPPENMDIDNYLKVFDIACEFIDTQEYCLIDFNGAETSSPKIFGSSSGWGDGSYPVYVTLNDKDDVIGIHIDYEILGTFTDEEIEEYISYKEEEEECVPTNSIKPKNLFAVLKYIFKG